MELLFTAGIIGIAAVVNILNFIVGMRNTPPGNIFLGTIHHPQDYFYYLSQFVQGNTHWFLSRNLYTNDFPTATAVGWVNVLMGKILGWFGLTYQWSYAAAVIITTIVFLSTVTYFIRIALPQKSAAFSRWLALLFFLISNTVPTSLFGASTGAHTYWNNYGEPFVRLGGVPHHLLMHTMVVLCLLCTALLIKARTPRSIIGQSIALAAATFTLAGINPVQWVWTGAAIGITVTGVTAFTLFRHRAHLRSVVKHLLLTMLPICIVLMAGLPMAVYLKQLFSLSPYTQLSAWEFTQNIKLTLPGLLLSGGPVVMLGILGIPIFLRNHTLPRILVFVYALGSLTVFLSPLPQAMHLSNVRFVSGITILFFALSAAELSTQLLHRREKLVHIPAGILVAAIIITCLIPLRAQIQDRITLDPKNAFLYVPTAVMQGYAEVIRQTPPDATILVFWPFEASLPAFTGRQIYFGHPLLTSDFDRKSGEAYFFIDKRMTQEEMADFLKRNRIGYLFGFNNTIPPQPLYDILYKNELISLYKVRPIH